MMDRTPIYSSSLASIGYDARQKLLEIEFSDGSIYEYAHVPAYLHRELMISASPGAFFDTFIKKGGYPYRRIQ